MTELHKLKIHLCAPPFAGHLFPLLEIGRFLQEEGFEHVTVLSTEGARASLELSNLNFVPLLQGHEEKISAIADPPYQVKNNPKYLLKQFEGNLSLMGILKAELESLWQKDKPDLVIGDSILPIAGLLAQEWDIPWWTTLATPCALETKRGVPSYLGGWSAKNDGLRRIQNAVGRILIRKFKQSVAWYYRKQLQALNISNLYRSNGEEVIYSPEKIFALGLKEFEFDRDWPASLEFIGSVTASPAFPHVVPNFEKDKRHVLVTLGTHLPWAKAKALAFIREVAETMPECVFHFSFGKATGVLEKSSKQLNKQNIKIFEYLPYDIYLENYDVAIIHGGTGITYSCIKAAVPMLVWPHDYDQFDHQARIVKAGIGLALRPVASQVVNDLELLFTSEDIKSNLTSLQNIAAEHKAGHRILECIQEHFDTTAPN